MSVAVIAVPLFRIDPESLHQAVLRSVAGAWRRLVALLLRMSAVFASVAIGNGSANSAKAEDERWVQRSKSGDRQAFEELVYRYQDLIFNLCLRLLGERADSEDAAQETFVKAFEAMHGFKGESAFSTWLFRIATNVCRNRRSSFWGRLSRRAIRLDRTVEDDEGNEHRCELPSDGETPEELLERKRTVQGVRRALMQLPADHREIIVLADIQDMSYEEIRTITGMTPGTIKSRLARGREALRRILRSR